MLDPRTFPRPPALEPVFNKLIQIRWRKSGALIAESRKAWWVLETYHPPTYYIPRTDVLTPLQSSAGHTSYCEWKGRAAYLSIAPASGTAPVQNRIWTYPSPNSTFASIKDHVSFYADTGVNGDEERQWDCYVDGEKVQAQPGDFYGGWVTSEIDTKWVKGRPGTRGW